MWQRNKANNRNHAWKIPENSELKYFPKKEFVNVTAKIPDDEACVRKNSPS